MKNHIMKIILKILIIFCIFLLLKECMGIFYTKMTHLSHDDLKWIKPAELYPTGIFMSNSGKKGRLAIIFTQINNDSNPFYISSSGSTYQANAGYKYILKQDGFKIEGYFWIDVSLETDSLEFSAGLNKFYTHSNSSLNESYRPLVSQCVIINRQTFNDCLIIDNSNSKYTEDVPHKISKYIISKKYGLIYYEFESGERYYRIFKNKNG